MPIRPQDRHHYGYHWRTAIRPRILRRAGGTFKRGKYVGGARCEHCRVLDSSRVLYHRGYPGCYFVLDKQLKLFGGLPVATCYDRETGQVREQWNPIDIADYIERRELREQLARLKAAASVDVEAVSKLLSRPIMVVVQIGVAHLNHTPGDDRPRNLRALCRRCHLKHDETHHKETRAVRKDLRRPLLAQLPPNSAIVIGRVKR